VLPAIVQHRTLPGVLVLLCKELLVDAGADVVPGQDFVPANPMSPAVPGTSLPVSGGNRGEWFRLTRP